MDDEQESEIVEAMFDAWNLGANNKTGFEAALAVAKPMIERELLRELLAYMNKYYDDCISVDITEWADERGIDLEAKSVADSVSRRADLNCEPSGEPLQNGLKPSPGDEKAGEGMDHPSSSLEDVDGMVERLAKAARVLSKYSAHHPRCHTDCLEWEAATLLRQLQKELGECLEQRQANFILCGEIAEERDAAETSRRLANNLLAERDTRVAELQTEIAILREALKPFADIVSEARGIDLKDETNGR